MHKLVYNKLMNVMEAARSTLAIGLLAAMPTSTNYTLKGYDLGASGGSGSSTTYNLHAVTGEQSGAAQAGTAYGDQSGVVPVIATNVPPAPAFTNPSSYYDRLKLVIDTGNNPSDTKYAIAISTDNFATVTNYVKSDHSVSPTLVIGDYQTFTAWGGASGFLILGLQPATTYTVKVKALQGNFSGSAYGPTASAATLSPSITFSVTTTLSAVPPFTANFNNLASGSVYDANADAAITLDTNALNGGAVYLRGTNGGLVSASNSFTLTSASADLDVTSKGYGAIVTATGQTSGGPLAAVAPFNGVSNNVGAVTSTMQRVAATSAAINGGSLTLRLKAKTDPTVPSASDYTDVLTIVAAMAF